MGTDLGSLLKGGALAGQPTVLTLPKRTGAVIQVGDPVYVRNGEAGNLPYWQGTLREASTNGLSADAQAPSAYKGSGGTFVMPLEPTARFIAAWRIVPLSRSQEHFSLTIKDTQTNEEKAYNISLRDVSPSSSDLSYELGHRYRHSPDGLKTAMYFKGNSSPIVMVVFENTNDTIAGFTMNGQALTSAINYVNSGARTNSTYGSTDTYKFSTFQWDSDSNGVCLMFNYDVGSVMASVHLPLTDYNCNSRYRGYSATAQWSSFNVFNGSSEPIMDLGGGYFLLVSYNASVHVMKRTEGDLNINVHSTDSTNTGSTSYGFWVKLADNKYIMVADPKLTATSNTFVTNTIELDAGKNITSTDYQAVMLKEDLNLTLRFDYVTSDTLVLKANSSDHLTRLAVPYDSTGIKWEERYFLPDSIMASVAQGYDRRQADCDRKRYLVFHGGRQDSLPEAIPCAIWDVEDYHDKQVNGSRDLYLGDALSVTGSEVTVAVGKPLVANNEQYAAGTRLGKYVTINDDYAVEYVDNPIEALRYDGALSTAEVTTLSGQSNFSMLTKKLKAGEWATGEYNYSCDAWLVTSLWTDLQGSLIVDGDWVFGHGSLGAGGNSSGGCVTQMSIKANSGLIFGLGSNSSNYSHYRMGGK